MFRFKTTYVIHIACWLLFMAFPLLFMNRENSANYSPWPILQAGYYWLFCATYIFIFYSNTLYFIPHWFFAKKYLNYAFALTIMLAAVYFIRPFDRLLNNGEHALGPGMHQGPPPGMPPPGFNQPGLHRPPPPGEEGRFDRRDNAAPDRHSEPPVMGNERHHIDMVSLFIYLMVVALGAAIGSVQQWQVTEQRVVQAEADKASAELSFLKAQINPHFLFNTLNNIYTLAVTQNAHTAASIMKLSNLMRYVTDEVGAHYVPLQSEVDGINDYIDLQRLRMGAKTQVEVSITGNLEDHQIPPLILMSFVENVFKYGISKHQPSTIRIGLAAEPHQLTFLCQNKIFKTQETTERVGIGIENSRQRLQHLYPQKHQLVINTDNELFTVNLILQV